MRAKLETFAAYLYRDFIFTTLHFAAVRTETEMYIEYFGLLLKLIL